LQQHFGAEVGAACWNDFSPKLLDVAGAAALTERAATQWPALRRRAYAVNESAARLAEVMRRAEGPAKPSDIGVDAKFYAGAVRHARFLRDRFTFLDLADDAGMLAGRL